MNLLERYQNLGQSNYISGRVMINHEACTGCKGCVQVCPATALELNAAKKSQMIEGAECIGCGDCIAVCKDDAIRIANFWNVPTGGFKTQGRKQATGKQAFPRLFQ